MFEIHLGPAAGVVMSAPLDASHSAGTLGFLNAIPEPRVIDRMRHDDIASAGLPVLLGTQKRARGPAGPRVVNVCAPILDIFLYAGFDRALEVKRSANKEARPRS